MADPEIIGRLDRMLAILKIANAEAIESTASRIRGDTLNAAILDLAADDWMGAGRLKSEAARQTSQSERTAARRICDLVALGALEQEGAGPSSKYKSTGII